ncbi:MAG: FKBP-type peptidyl-prolyl cis-trans isomerase [Bacteroidota bacterium]
MLKNIITFALLALAFAACSEDPNQGEIDQERIEEYLEDSNQTAQVHPSGLYYIINEMGQGGSPALQDTVEVAYQGSLTNGLVFDETDPGKTIEFPLFGLIEAWQIGIPLIEKGGSITLITPSRLAYGETGNHPLAREVLVFEVDLVDWKEGEE